MTDKDYQAIQEITRRLRNVENRLTDLTRRVDAIEESLLKYDERFLDEQEIRDMVKKMVTMAPIRPHNHKSAQQGGDAYAALGGNLI